MESDDIRSTDLLGASPVHLISLGAGVQSSTMALMAAAGEIKPMPLAAIFADTQAEPASVYQWLEWLEKQLPFPVHRVTAGNLADEATMVRVSKKTGETYLGHGVPVFQKYHNGKPAGMNFRICTDKHKLVPIRKEVHRLRNGRPVVMWIGISRDEIHRMKPSNHKAITNRWPLVDAGMSRVHCLRWMKMRNFPEPPRSACTFCPYHSDADFQKMKDTDPESFASAVAFEKKLQTAQAQIPRMSAAVPYLHETLVPLDTVDFTAKTKSQHPDLFGNECEGLCGV